MSRTDLAELPDEVRDLIGPHVAETPDLLDAISIAIAQKRDEAKAARTSSGIEQIWRDCEERYIGIDDLNRMEFQNAKWMKPFSPDGPVMTGREPRGMEHHSTVFVRLTARYVDAGAAKLGEILLPPDDKSFSFSEMPNPELIRAKGNASQVVHDGLGGAPLTRPARPGEAPVATPPLAPPQTVATPALAPTPAPGASGPAPGGAPPGPALPGAMSTPMSAAPTPAPRVPLTVKDIAEEAIEAARASAKAAEKRIYGWMIGCQYTAEVRKVIFDSARIGIGVLKGPFPKPHSAIVATKSNEGVEIQIREDVKPAAKWIDPWNIFPDAACGENIHEGDYVFERDYLSARQVRNLRETPGYVAAQLDAVLAEGPMRPKIEGDESPGEPSSAERKGRYEVWYYYGTITPAEMGCICGAAGQAMEDGAIKPGQSHVSAIVTLINGRAVRATLNPLDSGGFPYHSMPWQRRQGHWAGIGVAEQIAAPQKMVNAATRAMLNNAGKSAGSQVVLDQGAVKPANGQWSLTPDKIWYKTGDASTDGGVNDVFAIHEIPNVTDALMKIIEYGLQLAEESTSIPLITQGQSGNTTPDTFGAAQLQNNNANQLLRSIGYSFDDYVTEPLVRQFYEWLLLDPDVPDDEKGEFQIDAHGSIALVERAIQDQSIAQMGAIVLNPAYGFDPKRWAALLAKSKRLDPADLQYSEEEQARIAQAPPPEAPAVTVAKIVQQTALTELAAKQQTDQRSAQNEQQIATAAQQLDGQKVQAEQHRTLTEATVKLHELQLKHDLALLEYANRNSMNLNQVKANLAKTAMTLDTQRQLNAADNAADRARQRPPEPNRPGRRAHPQRSTPPLAPAPDQVPGRAGNGRAFEQGNAP